MNAIDDVAVFNEWMRRFVEDPNAYEHEFQVVSQFVADNLAGRTPTYGEKCVAYMDKLRTQLAA